MYAGNTPSGYTLKNYGKALSYLAKHLFLHGHLFLLPQKDLNSHLLSFYISSSYGPLSMLHKEVYWPEICHMIHNMY